MFFYRQVCFNIFIEIKVKIIEYLQKLFETEVSSSSILYGKISDVLKALPVRVENTLVNYRVSLVGRREKPRKIYRDNYLLSRHIILRSEIENCLPDPDISCFRVNIFYHKFNLKITTIAYNISKII